VEDMRGEPVGGNGHPFLRWFLEMLGVLIS
jgi:hypothetical protein